MTVPSPAASVILTTYRQPEALRRVLWGFGAQTVRDFELVVADDGSGLETASVVDEARRDLHAPVRHVWHEDLGFRKCTILNRAILEAEADYLIFTDGDCIPRGDFVETHLRLRRPHRFLSGGYLRIPEKSTEQLDRDAIESGRFTDPSWLMRAGWRPGRRRLRLLRSAFLAGMLDRITPTSPTWNGCNASVARSDALRVNGFDAGLGSGGQDREFGARLENAGIRGVQIRHRAVLIHLEHPRPYRTPETIADNLRARRDVEASGRTRAKSGIAELT